MMIRSLISRLIIISTIFFAFFFIPRIFFRSSKVTSATLIIHGHASAPSSKRREGFSNISMTSNLDRLRDSNSTKTMEGRSRRLKNGTCILSSLTINTLCCDRANFKTDICIMRGDIRTHSSSSTLHLYNADLSTSEIIKPYPRKWENSIMSTVNPLHLIALQRSSTNISTSCDVHHDVPALVFYAGGYTGNLYHEFLDGIVPLYISSVHFEKQVVFVILKYRNWWASKYHHILSTLSAYPPVDFFEDRRVHCFPSVVVGLQVHEELSIDATRMPNNRSIIDFRAMLDKAYGARVRKMGGVRLRNGHKLTIIARNGSRGIDNEKELMDLGREVGFEVEIVRPGTTMDLAIMYDKMNDTDVVVGVHGAALTHFLFMRPGAVLVQIVPLGLAWAAETCFGNAAKKMGLRY